MGAATSALAGVLGADLASCAAGLAIGLPSHVPQSLQAVSCRPCVRQVLLALASVLVAVRGAHTGSLVLPWGSGFSGEG